MLKTERERSACLLFYYSIEPLTRQYMGGFTARNTICCVIQKARVIFVTLAELLSYDGARLRAAQPLL